MYFFAHIHALFTVVMNANTVPARVFGQFKESNDSRFYIEGSQTQQLFRRLFCTEPMPVSVAWHGR